MDKKQPYRIVASGKKAERRDYSKVSGHLELPNLVEIQTDSFAWFKNEGINEVFNEIYPIQNYGGNIKLKFAGYEFGEPKYNAEESMYRECNYAAPLKARMELEITDNQTGEVINKWEDVFLGDFPLMTETEHLLSMEQNVSSFLRSYVLQGHIFLLDMMKKQVKNLMHVN